MGVASREANTQILTMGNTAARQRLKFKDFAYIAKNTNFASRGIVEDYYNDLIAKCPIGKMDLEQFKVTFRLAFPERPEEKLLLLTEKVANVDKTDGRSRSTAWACCSTCSATARPRTTCSASSISSTRTATAPSALTSSSTWWRFSSRLAPTLARST